MFIEKRVEDAEELTRIKELMNEAKLLLEEKKLKASAEKLYDAVKHSIILLSKRYGLKEVEEAERKGEWDFELLNNATIKLHSILGEKVLNLWNIALHAEVAAENGILKKKNLEADLQDVENMLNELFSPR